MYEEITEEFLSQNYDIKNVRKREGRGELYSSVLRSSVLSKPDTPKQHSKLIGETDIDKSPTRKKTGGEIKRDGSVDSEEDALRNFISMRGSSQQILKRDVSFNFSKTRRQTCGLVHKKSSVVSFDEMDISGTAYSKVTKRVRKRSTQGQTNVAISPALPHMVHRSFFVPLALCIKTKNQSHESAEQLLLALLSLLQTDTNSYRNNVQNLIYSYSEFVSHAMLLTHMVGPPPMTQYVIQVGKSEVLFSEGLIGELPCDGDVSAAQLFSLVDPDFVILMWTAMLLDIRVIVYTSNINEYFFIMKALNQLMFPFKWHHSKGVIPLLYFLLQPPPYCFGLMKTMFPNKVDIVQSLCDEHIPHIMLDVSSQSVHTFPAPEDMVPYPNEESLKFSIRDLCKRFGVERTGVLVNKPEQRHVEFSRQVRTLFLGELTGRMRNFDSLVRKAKSEDFYEFKTSFIQQYSENQCLAKREEELRFMRELTESQCFACAFHEIYSEEQENCARVQAMRRRGKIVAGEQERVTIASPQSVALSRVARLVESASPAKARAKGKSPDDSSGENSILLKIKINWGEEIEKMQGMMLKQQPENGGRQLRRAVFGAKKFSAFAQSISSDAASTGNRTVIQGSPAPPGRKDEVFDFRLTIEEKKMLVLPDRGLSVICNLDPSGSVVPSSPPNVNSTTIISSQGSVAQRLSDKMRRQRKGPFFYGPTGLLAFCQELFGTGRKDRLADDLLDEVKAMIERARGAVSNNKQTSSSSTGESPIVVRAKDDCLSEGTVIGQPRLTSPLLEALIEPKDILRRSTGGRLEEPYITFSSTALPQFYVFCATYYSKYGQHSYDVVKVCVERITSDIIVLPGSVQAADAANSILLLHPRVSLQEADPAARLRRPQRPPCKLWRGTILPDYLL